MDLTRFYCNPITAPAVELAACEAHHLALVRRLGPGDKVELFDGLGSLAIAAIKAVRKGRVTLEVEDLRVAQKNDHRQVIIATSVAKGERFDELITKCTELGVDRILPVLFERTVKKPDNPKTLERWQNLAISAGKQCRTLFLPRIDMPMSLHQATELLKADHSKAQLLLGGLDSDLPYLIQLPWTDLDVAAFVGPEGGITQAEREFFKDSGAKTVRLTLTTLRVETAALAFASILTTQRDVHS